MTDYTTITDGQIDAGSPLDETLMFSLRDNLVSVLERDATAPRLATAVMPMNKFLAGTSSNSLVAFNVTSGTSAQDLDTVAGIMVHGGTATSSAARTLYLSMSDDDGSTWSSNATLIVNSGGRDYTYALYLDLVTGEYWCSTSGVQVSDIDFVSGTIAGAPFNAFRMTGSDTGLYFSSMAIAQTMRA